MVITTVVAACIWIFGFAMGIYVTKTDDTVSTIAVKPNYTDPPAYTPAYTAKPLDDPLLM